MGLSIRVNVTTTSTLLSVRGGGKVVGHWTGGGTRIHGLNTQTRKGIKEVTRRLVT